MVNSVDPDQLASSEAKKPTDLDLHCLQRQGISGFSRTRDKIIIASCLESLLSLTEARMFPNAIDTIKFCIKCHLKLLL